VKPPNLSDRTTQSTHIVRGTVEAVRERGDGNRRPYTETDIEVSESVKGSAPRDLTFRQFGLQSPRPAENGRKYVGLVAGMPRYAAGDQVLLFLGPVSGIGYRTTVGQGQGHFMLRGGSFENDANNAGLFRNVSYGNHNLSDKEKSMTAVQQGAVAAETFVGLVRRAVNGNWWTPSGPRTPRPRGLHSLPTTPATVSTQEGGIQ